MRELLVDIPWWLPAIVIALGVVLLVSGNNRQMAGVRNGGAVIAVLAIAWAALSFVVDSPRKICERLTHQAVDAVAEGDWKTFDELLAPRVDARFVGRTWRVDGQQAVDAAARMIAKNSGLHSAAVRRVIVAGKGPTRTVSFTAYADTELAPGHPIDSNWEFDWQQNGDRWLLQELRVLKVDETAPEGIRESLNKR